MEQENFRYFDIDEIMDRQGFTEAERRQGMKLAARNDTHISSMEIGYYSGMESDEMACDVKWCIVDGSSIVNSRVIFTSDKLLLTRCSCPSCNKNRYSWYYEYMNVSDKHCGYLAGLMLAAKEQLEKEPQGDATSQAADRLLGKMSRQRLSAVTARANQKDQQVSLEPVLRRSEDDLTLSFRIVEKKALMIRDLFEFMEHVDKGETALYGTQTNISHKIDNFDAQSQDWIAFIREVLQEEERTRQRMERQAERTYSYYREKKYAAIDLYGWRLDHFYEMIGGGTVSFPGGGAALPGGGTVTFHGGGTASSLGGGTALSGGGTTSFPGGGTVSSPGGGTALSGGGTVSFPGGGAALPGGGSALPGGGLGAVSCPYRVTYEYTIQTESGRSKKVKAPITCRDADPHIPLKITPDIRGRKRTFYGIKAQFIFPSLYYGTEKLYYFEKECLCRTDRVRLAQLQPLMNAAEEGLLALNIGRARLAEFYYSLLPQLGDAVEISEERPDLIYAYIPADISFRFYLDVEDGDITCSPYAVYDGEKGEDAQRTGAFREELNETDSTKGAKDAEASREDAYGTDSADGSTPDGGNGKYAVPDGRAWRLTAPDDQRVKPMRAASAASSAAGVNAAGAGGRSTSGSGREVSLLDSLSREKLPSWRMADREREVLYPLMRMFEKHDEDLGALTTGGREEAVYDFLESGLAQLEEMGEVHVTSRFRNLTVIRRVNLSVGVSMESNLLDLEIQTSNLSQEELLDVLHSYKFRKKYYRLKSGSFLNMEDPTLGMLNEMLSTLQITDKEFLKGNIHLPVYRTLYLNRLLEENEEVYNTRDVRFRSLVKNFKTIQDADYEPPASLVGTLRGYQVSGYKWLRTMENCGFSGILADEMGLGKTLQAIAVLLARKEEQGAAGQRVSLVVCPASLVYNWCEEFARFAPALRVAAVAGTQAERRDLLAKWQEYDALVTSYDLLKRDIAEYEDKRFDYEIIDEAQYIKNHTTAAAKAVKVVHAEHRLALTGTPIENRLSELWSIFDFLMPGFLYRYETFRRQFEAPIVKNEDAEAMARLRKMTGPFIVRRLKSDVLRDLPDKLEESRYVRMESEQRRLYDAQVTRMQTMLTGQSDEEFQKARLQILAEITKLRQICCDPSLCVEDYHGGSAKLDGCMELIQSAIDGGHRILLFSQFVSMLEILQARLQQEGIAFYCITGATSKEKRLQMVKAFNSDDVPVFLISLKAGGVGLNLTGADVVIHYDPWWNLAVQNQATDRAHRIGQTRKVTVYKMITSQTIEEKIQKLQETKKDLAEQILSGADTSLTQLTREDLLALVGQ